MITEVWSGGQTGAGIAGLRAAKRAGIATGGWIPLGWRTEGGSRPEYGPLFGLQETRSEQYPMRTEANIIGTDGMLWIGDPTSRGGRLTKRYAGVNGKPFIPISIALLENHFDLVDVQTDIWGYKIRRLNIAGNRDAPEDLCEEWCLRLFHYVNRLESAERSEHANP